jgi:hypothetical protein
MFAGGIHPYRIATSGMTKLRNGDLLAQTFLKFNFLEILWLEACS